MTTLSEKTLLALKEHAEKAQIKLYTPDTPGYGDVEPTFVIRQLQVLGVARPQSAEDVATLLRFCVDNKVDFTVRVGGHDCAGRSRVDGALVIDLRDISYVHVAEDKMAARIGGGTLTGYVENELGKHGLVTPCGNMLSVGYVGWSTLGGYGPLSTRYGLGVDQIIGAKIVNAAGEVVDADDDLLVGIRGGGGTLGIIVELTIKTYPLDKILASTIVYDSSNMASAMTTYAEFYEKLIATEELPPALQLQPMTTELPNLGMAFAVMATWAGPDRDEGRRWIKRIATAAPCIMEATQELALLEHLENNERYVVSPSHGRVYTISVKSWTSQTMEIMAKHSANAPGGSLAISMHTLRSPKQNDASVFGARLNHHVLEIMAIMGTAALASEREAWASRLKQEIIANDPDNVLEESYVSLGSDADTDLSKAYGRHYPRLLDLKKKYDVGNVFKNTVPRLVPIDSGVGV